MRQDSIDLILAHQTTGEMTEYDTIGRELLRRTDDLAVAYVKMMRDTNCAIIRDDVTEFRG